MNYGYHDLTRLGWSKGVHRAPVGYGHPWLVVTVGGTFGAWSREEARKLWRTAQGLDPDECAAVLATATR